MATFLTTRKMSPALAARVEASVRGRPAGQNRASPKLVLLLRVLALGTVVTVVVGVVLMVRARGRALDGERAALVAEVRSYSARLGDKDRGMVPRVEAWVLAHAGDYEGDYVAPELRDARALAAAMARPTAYLRGPIESFQSSAGIASAAESSYRDAFVLCLFDPPATRTEKALLRAAAAAFVGGKHLETASQVERFHSALVAAPFFEPAWEEEVRAADRAALGRLRLAVKRAPLEEALRVLRASLLLTVMDEPKEGDGPTEVDGACRHLVRVAAVDLETEELLFRQRKLVDPAWISSDVRLEYAHGINSCELALELRAALGAATP